MSASLITPKLYVSLQVWQRMMSYIINCPTEINGFGIIERLSSVEFVLRETFITDQNAGPAHVEVNPLVLARMMDELRARGQDTGAVKFQWHSHVNMQAYFSDTDLSNIENWAGDWLISLVANKRGDYSCRLDVLRGVRVGVELRPEIFAPIDEATMRETSREITARVRTQPSTLHPRGKRMSTAPSTHRTVSLGAPEDGIRIRPEQP